MSTRKMSPQAFADAEPAVLADLDRAEKLVAELGTPPELRVLLGGDPGRGGPRGRVPR